MSWVQTTPTEEELSRVPAIGSHWINKKIEKRLAERPAAISKTNLKHLEIIITGARFRNDEVEDSLQICYCLAYDPAKTDLFMQGLDRFYQEFRSKDKKEA